MEAKPNMIKKYNKPVVGLVLGLVLPALTFMLYFAYLALTTEQGVSLSDYFDTVYNTGAFTAILSLCVLPNLAIFFIFKKLDYWYAIKGLIVSVLIYTLSVFVIKLM